MTRREDLQRLVVIRRPTEDFLELDVDRCTGCAQCAVVCPTLIWKMHGAKAVLPGDYRDRCIECAGCWQICAPGAIGFRCPPGGEGVVVSQG